MEAISHTYMSVCLTIKYYSMCRSHGDWVDTIVNKRYTNFLLEGGGGESSQ